MTKAWPKYSAAISSRPTNEPKRTGRLVRAAGRGASPRAMVAALNQPATSLESGVLTRASPGPAARS
eukprot:scaffold31404_cov48-Phaeocystis_antarctica.AAC.1